MAKALYSAEDEVKDAFINSAEFFGETRTVNIITGKGSDISYTSGKITGEFVVQCKKENDVELYADFSYYDMEKKASEKSAQNSLNWQLKENRQNEVRQIIQVIPLCLRIPMLRNF